jgi:hydrogenase maturation protein HypF
MVEEFAVVNDREKEALESIRRPIVVVDQRPNSPLSPEIAHGLHNVGVMLPYTGLHLLLFDYLDFPVVMTSANMPGRPILIDNDEIISKLERVADYFLLHNRRIIARCDDSVVRFSGGARRFLRRSRSWAPSPIRLDLKSNPILALGAEFDSTIALFHEGSCYVSQHIGDVDDLDTLDFLQETVKHLARVTGLDIPDVVACDLHPKFLTTRLAEKMSENPIRVQHHHAHIASVLGEARIDEAVGIAVDGVGYGDNGAIWGGEVLRATRSNFKRIGGISEMLMPGGDLATKYPARMLAGIFHTSKDLSEILSRHAKFPRGDEEQKVVEKQVQSRVNSPITTSAGRFLDATSGLLDVCHERTYEGEPAMKLEALATRGNPLDVRPETRMEKGRRVLDAQSLARELLELKERGFTREDIAATAQDCLARGLADIAVVYALDQGIDVVALSGGVAYNNAITSRIRQKVEDAGLTFATNKRLPCGDGGISFGQIIVAASRQM